MVYGQVSPNRPVQGGLPVPLPAAFNDPPLMDLDYTDLRWAERLSIGEARCVLWIDPGPVCHCGGCSGTPGSNPVVPPK
jgi:hypothetical protein